MHSFCRIGRICVAKSTAADRTPAAVNRRTEERMLSKFCDAWPSHWCYRQAHSPFEFLGENAILRVHRLLPRDRLAGVRGHAPHDAQQCACRHSLTVVHRFPFANRREKNVMLVLIHTVLGSFESPGGLSFDARQRTAADGQYTLGTHNVVGVL